MKNAKLNGCAALCCTYNETGICRCKNGVLIGENGGCVMFEMEPEKIQYHTEKEEKVKMILGVEVQQNTVPAEIIGFKGE